MDKLAYFKDGIMNIAIEKEALSLEPIIDGAKTIGKSLMQSNIGKSVINSGLGTKMAVGAGVGAVTNAMRTPGQNEDRLSNAVKGAFGGATTGLMTHGLTSGLKDMTHVASETVNEMYMEKMALFGMGAAAKAGLKAGELGAKQVIKEGEQVADTFGNSVKKFYNRNLAGGVVKNTVIGAGVGGAMGAMKYDPNQDDGSFGKSRFGAMTSGAMAGAGAGLASGLIFKKTNLSTVPKVPGEAVENAAENVAEEVTKAASYRELVFDVAMEKKAASIPSTIINGAKDIAKDFTKLDEVTRVAIGSGIGSTVGILTALSKQKDKEDVATKDRLKEVGKAGMEGALMGGAIGGFVGYKPGQFKKSLK